MEEADANRMEDVPRHPMNGNLKKPEREREGEMEEADAIRMEDEPRHPRNDNLNEPEREREGEMEEADATRMEDEPRHPDGPSIAQMAVDEDDIFYKFDHKERGTAVIFNHEVFDMKDVAKRSETNADCEHLKACLKRLGFDVVVYQDLNEEEVMEKVDTYAKQNHSDFDCFLMCVLSYGENGKIYAKDKPYTKEKLWMPFAANKCLTLAGKPKLFFIQAGPAESMTQPDAAVIAHGARFYKIPVYADFLIAHSTSSASYFSADSARDGSRFIQALCTEFNENYSKTDILGLLTFVNCRVTHHEKEVPCITSMLTRLLKFEHISIEADKTF